MTTVPKGSDSPIEDLRAWAHEKGRRLACLTYDQAHWLCQWCLSEVELPVKRHFGGGYDRHYCSEGCADADVTLHEWYKQEAETRKATAERLRV